MAVIWLLTTVGPRYRRARSGRCWRTQAVSFAGPATSGRPARRATSRSKWLEPIFAGVETIDILGSRILSRALIQSDRRFGAEAGSVAAWGSTTSPRRTTTNDAAAPPARRTSYSLRLRAARVERGERVIRCAGAPGGGSRPASASYRKATATARPREPTPSWKIRATPRTRPPWKRPSSTSRETASA